ncbi:MAG: hypothetical protein U0228_26635 [Myxococcaceae bacterium]
MDEQQLSDALAKPPGAAVDLLPAAITAYFTYRWPRRAEAPEVVDGHLRHLAGGTSWASELVRQKQHGSAFDRTLALGFKDAAWADVEAFVPLNSVAIARILHARLGLDSAETLLGLARRATEDRVRNAALAAAIVASGPNVPAGLEAELSLLSLGWPPLAQAAFQVLGAARASDVALRSLRTFEIDSEHAFQSLAPVIECFHPTFDDRVLEELAARFGQKPGCGHWEGLGDRLRRSGERDAALGFLQRYEASTGFVGWRWAIRAFVALDVSMGQPLPEALDRYADPADAAQQGYDTWKLTVRLLEAMGGARAEVQLRDVKFAKSSDLLRFVASGYLPQTLARFAEAHVALRDDPHGKNTLIATRLQPLGPAFVEALKLALAEVKPKTGYLRALERNLEPAAWAELSKWLAERPEPKKKKSAAKKKASPTA